MEDNKNLEKRMYFLVLYSLSGIQKGIQAGHAALEYARQYGNDEEYADFIENWKTWIILNGGTTNNKYESIGLTGIVKSILEYNKENPDNIIKYTTFNEPDLNDALTAICLIVDERVFNREDYPDFNVWLNDISNYLEIDTWTDEDKLKYYIDSIVLNKEIVFLKELLNTKKLA